MVPVAPLMATPSRSHCTLIVPRPSASTMALVFTVSTWFSVAVPVIVGSPVGASFTPVTADVCALVTVSEVPCPSV